MVEPTTPAEGGRLIEYGSDNSWMNIKHSEDNTVEADYDNDDMLLMSSINKARPKSNEPNVDEYLEDLIERHCQKITIDDIYADDDGDGNDSNVIIKKKPSIPETSSDEEDNDD